MHVQHRLRTALAISVLRSMKDWLSIALTFTVICGGSDALTVGARSLPDGLLDGVLLLVLANGAPLADCQPSAGAVRCRASSETGGGGV